MMIAQSFARPQQPLTMVAARLLLALTVLAWLEQQVQAGAPPAVSMNYMIRGKLVRTVPEGVSQLRRFVPLRQDKEERCQRLAVLLHTMSGSQMDSFQIAELALMRRDQLAPRFRSIVVDALRNLYISAIEAFIQLHKIDASFMELVRCLGDKFRSVDAKARSFLNNEQLKQLVDQYKVVAALPVAALEEPAKHRVAGLKLEDLNPLIRELVYRLFHQDGQKVAQLFGAPVAPTSRPVSVSASVAVQTPAAAPVESRTEQSAVVAATAKPAAVEQSAGEAESQTGAAEGQTLGELDETTHNYLSRMFGAISQVYNTLPLSAKLGDRCQAYSFVVNANEDDLSQEIFLQTLIKSVDEHIKQVGAISEVSLAGQDDRENLLFAGQFADQYLGQADPEALQDLHDCCAQIATASGPVDEQPKLA